MFVMRRRNETSNKNFYYYWNGCWCFNHFASNFGFMGLKNLEEAKTVKELTNTAILVLIFCSVVGGVMMLCMKDQDLIEN